MRYPIPPSFAKDSFSVDWNQSLSDTDKRFIAKVYPNHLYAMLLELSEMLRQNAAANGSPSRDSSRSSGSILYTGTFHTPELRPCWKPRANNEQSISLDALFSSNTKPKFFLGLNKLHICRTTNIRVHTYASTTRNNQTRAQIHLDTWADTTLYSAGCSWLATKADDPDFQVGYFNTQDDHPCDRPKVHTSRHIKFKRAYNNPPMVVVWLSQLNMDRKRNWRVRAYATDITTAGFTVHADTWGDSLLYSAGVSWIAYPSDKKNVASGRCSTKDIRNRSSCQRNNEKRVSFFADKKMSFTAPPRVVVGINTLNVDCSHNMRLKVYADQITKSGMTCHMNSWSDSVLYAAGMSYIALDQSYVRRSGEEHVSN